MMSGKVTSVFTAQEVESSLWCVYALLCSNGALYIGSTNDLNRRLGQHARGKGSKYVRSFSPFQLAQVIPCEDGREARSLEGRLKRLKRSQKLKAMGIEGNLGISDSSVSALLYGHGDC